MKSQQSVDTIVARATAAGVGAIAVVRVSGPLALSLTDALLKKPVGDKPSHSAHLRSMYDADGLMDEALITLFKGGQELYRGRHGGSFGSRQRVHCFAGAEGLHGPWCSFG